LLTVMRTNCDPAAASDATCCAVDAGSAVSVLVIDWTTTGCEEPTRTPPMLAVTDGRRGLNGDTSGNRGGGEGGRSGGAGDRIGSPALYTMVAGAPRVPNLPP
jgi:hypothetical protein